MGSLTVPSSGWVYVDAQVIIYTVEKHPVYFPLLQPLWQAVQSNTIDAATSELSILETLVGPLKKHDKSLGDTYDLFFQQPGIQLVPVTQLVLRMAAKLRATTKLRTPDAIHAASALVSKCVLLVTNDYGFRGLSGIPVVFLDDVLKPQQP